MVIFKVIRWMNLFSTGNAWNEVWLNKSATTLIVGKNGHGKSTLLDALTFALFGKPFRNINKPNLVNSINGKGLKVELEFSIGPKSFKIIRGIGPNIFEVYIDGELQKQDAISGDYQSHLENNILKFNHKAFTQIVILGSKSFVPFMKLKSADRRNIIENLLDIEIFSSMNKIAKDHFTKVKEDVITNKYNIDNAKSKITLHESYVKEAEKNNQEEINHLNDEIKKFETTNIDLSTKIANIDELIANTSIGDIQALQSLGMKIDTKINDKKKELKFYQVNDNCPSCKQTISEGFRETTMRNLLQDIEKRETGLKELQTQLIAMKEKQQYVGELLKQKNDFQYQVKTNNDLIVKNGKKVLALQGKNVLSDDMMDQAKNLHDQLDAFTNERNQLLEDQAYYQAAVGLLKDGGIKAQIIKQYLPVINSLVNKYLAAMDFHISFELDEEFDETIKSRHRDDFTYDSFSEGEKQKIDIALLFAWRAVAKLKNSMNTNLLIMDEIFDSSLDGLGADLVLSILATLPEGTNVFVISHRELLHDRFSATIRFEKRNNFSEIVELET